MKTSLNVLIFGATGMVGDGVLHECTVDSRVQSIVTISRSPLAFTHPKIRDVRRTDFRRYDDLGAEFGRVDACFFCLGASAAGLSEAEYRIVTFDTALAAAKALALARPQATFCYVSGEGTNSSAQGGSMWARVKGETENALLALPLEAYMFRPGFIRPRPGVRSKTLWYRLFYAVAGPLYPLLRAVAPSHVTTAENIGRAMIAVAASGHPKRILGNDEINALATAT